MSDESHTAVSCARRGTVMRRPGKTGCTTREGDPGPSRPRSCPGDEHADLVASARGILEGDGEDARLARAAATVEGLGYERTAGDARARWTRVEDAIAFAREMVFNKHSRAPVTTLVVKDRVTGHNPVSVLYGEHYCRCRRRPLAPASSRPVQAEEQPERLR